MGYDHLLPGEKIDFSRPAPSDAFRRVLAEIPAWDPKQREIDRLRRRVATLERRLAVALEWGAESQMHRGARGLWWPVSRCDRGRVWSRKRLPMTGSGGGGRGRGN